MDQHGSKSAEFSMERKGIRNKLKKTAATQRKKGDAARAAGDIKQAVFCYRDAFSGIKDADVGLLNEKPWSEMLPVLRQLETEFEAIAPAKYVELYNDAVER